MKLKMLFLLEWFAKVNGFHIEFDNMTTMFGSKQDVIVMHRASRED